MTSTHILFYKLVRVLLQFLTLQNYQRQDITVSLGEGHP